MTLKDKIKIMKARENMFRDMAEHYEMLSEKCFWAHVKLDEQLDRALSKQWENQRAMGGIERAFQALDN